MPLQDYFKIVALCFLTCLSACDSSEKAPNETKFKEAITLNDSNLNAFTVEFATHYLTTLKGLTNASQKAKKAAIILVSSKIFNCSSSIAIPPS